MTAAAVFIVLLVPSIVLAASQPLQSLGNQIVGFFNAATALLMLGGIVVFLYGTTNNIFKTANGETRDMKNYLLWGIGALFIMFSVWGILSILQNTIFSSSGANAGGGTNQSQSPTYSSVITTAH